MASRRRDDDGEKRAFKVTVHVAGCPTPFRVACGAGLQTVRWLASVVAQRYAARPQPGGRRRHREAALLQRGRFMPMAVTTLAGDVLHPSSRLRDVLRFTDDELCMSLQKDIILDQMGSIRRTAWASDAFVLSDSGRRRVRTIRAELAEREAVAKADEAAKMEEQHSQQYEESVNRMLAVNLDDPRAVATATLHEWPNIRVTQFSKDPEEVENLKLIILRNFVVASDLYKHYCGTLATSTVSTMCSIEFGHFVLNTGALALPRDKAAIPRILESVNASRSTDNGNTTEVVTQFEFMEALIACAVHKYTADRGGRAVRPSVALARLFEEQLEPAAKRLSADAVRAAMQTREMTMTLRKLLPAVRAIFDVYRAKDHSSTAGSPFAINLLEFAMFLTDAGLLGASANKTADGEDVSNAVRKEMSMQQARMLFAGCQLAEQATTASGKPILSDTPDEMVLSEFVEALCRLSLQRFEADGLALPAALHKMMTYLCRTLEVPLLNGGARSGSSKAEEGGAAGSAATRAAARPGTADSFTGKLTRLSALEASRAYVNVTIRPPSKTPRNPLNGAAGQRIEPRMWRRSGASPRPVPSPARTFASAATPRATGASLGGRFSVPATPNAGSFAWD